MGRLLISIIIKIAFVIICIVGICFFTTVLMKIVNNIDMWFAEKVSKKTYKIVNYIGFIIMMAAFVFWVML